MEPLRPAIAGIEEHRAQTGRIIAALATWKRPTPFQGQERPSPGECAVKPSFRGKGSFRHGRDASWATRPPCRPVEKIVISTQAGSQCSMLWIPACAGMTNEGTARRKTQKSWIPACAGMTNRVPRRGILTNSATASFIDRKTKRAKALDLRSCQVE